MKSETSTGELHKLGRSVVKWYEMTTCHSGGGRNYQKYYVEKQVLS